MVKRLEIKLTNGEWIDVDIDYEIDENDEEVVELHVYDHDTGEEIEEDDYCASEEFILASVWDNYYDLISECREDYVC